MERPRRPSEFPPGAPTKRDTPRRGQESTRHSTRLSDASRYAAERAPPSDPVERNKLRAIHGILVMYDSLPEDEQEGFLDRAVTAAEKAFEQQTQMYLQGRVDNEFDKEVNKYFPKIMAGSKKAVKEIDRRRSTQKKSRTVGAIGTLGRFHIFFLSIYLSIYPSLSLSSG